MEFIDNPNMFSKTYNPKATEEKILKLRERNLKKPKTYNLKPKSYTILLPLPNITGSLHMGHALNATISDILIRWHRQQGYNAVWLPGLDHAGIATQNVVEKELRKQGQTRFDLGREKFIERVWQWKEKYGEIILEQLKKLGASCDWSRTRFTMDPEYSRAVSEAFIHYYNKGWIYQAERTINWCTRCQTSISDLEVAYKEEKAKFYYIKYGPFTLATVRPETKFGDTALAVNLTDKRYKKYIGKEIEIESLDVSGSLDKPAKTKVLVKVVGDKAVDPEFGTGVIKVTPAHDITDYEISLRHKLPLRQVIDENGRMNKNAGKYSGLKVKEARQKVAADLKAVGLLLKEEPYSHRVAVCSRCDSTVEPLPSEQWFLKMDPSTGSGLAMMARKAVKSGKVKIIPKNFEKIFFDWFTPSRVEGLNNIRDWCISRQLWWGHRLPVWFHESKCVPILGREKEIEKCEHIKVSLTEPKCEHCAAKFIQSEDVLDTWFSSALWPFAGLNKSDVKKFYPSSVLVTARDIINLWVGRMIFSGWEFMGKAPFPEVFIHATVLAKEGGRMSKSLGTGVDPLDLIEKYGADATRFGLIWQSMGNQDIHWAEEHVVAGRKFANKIWNASRFVLQQIGESRRAGARRGSKPKAGIVTQFEQTKTSAEKHLAKYEFGQALHEIYDFFWHDFCDKYLEEAKNSPGPETNRVLIYVLGGSLKLIHPFMPFITEEVRSIMKISDY